MADARLQVERLGRVARLRFDNPPVNALDDGLRRAFGEAVDVILADARIDGALVTAAGSSFVVGADLRELERGVQPPFLGDMLRRLEQAPKRFVAVLNGDAMGGGLEIALACDARVVLGSARLALPEIRLALMPGAGGTQRLPRLLGATPALDLMLSGRAIDALAARALGLVDVVAGTAAEAEAAGWRLLEAPSPAVRPAPHAADGAALSAARARIAADPHLSLLPAAGAIVDAVEAAFADDVEAGFALERALFLRCRDTPEAAHAIRAFLAERAARRRAPQPP